ncbi:MAG: sigma-54-dependent Fis family transcriptional regulator [Deltaproteobacteria bacterium]|nr:sigma-54-dependent Fis family transcriptional regulator [Deltaproteobacteria bacterium]
MSQYRILVVEDDIELRSTLFEALEQGGFDVLQAENGIEALDKIRTNQIDLALLDVNMPQMNGLDCLTEIKNYDPSIIVIIMTAYSAIEDAVRAIKAGAYNYLAKPIKHQAVVEMVQRALDAQAMIRTMAYSAPIVTLENGEFVGHSGEMKKIFNIIYKLAKVDTSVLIRGDSGTGKELVARALHYNSSRKDEKLIPINCSAISETLFESELFGHERGAFTGADQRQIGRFQYAEGGTLFLDEIGDLSLSMQVKLLRVLQERKFTPVGSSREIEMNVRIIAATNRNLEEMIQKGTFREDLFYRLNVIPIYLPPLRERKDDIENLVNYFIRRFAQKHKKSIFGITVQAMEKLSAHHWPGNIRELENTIEHAFVIESGDKLSAKSLPAHFNAFKLGNNLNSAAPIIDSSSAPSVEDADLLDYNRFKEEFEREFIIRALKTFKGRINQTALHAKIPKKTLLRKLEKYSIKAEDFRL